MIYRRCSCRDESGKPYGNLPENASEQQTARACPVLLSDPKHGKWGYYLSRGFGFDPKTKKMKRLQTRVANFSSKRSTVGVREGEERARHRPVPRDEPHPVRSVVRRVAGN